MFDFFYGIVELAYEDPASAILIRAGKIILSLACLLIITYIQISTNKSRIIFKSILLAVYCLNTVFFFWIFDIKMARRYEYNSIHMSQREAYIDYVKAAFNYGALFVLECGCGLYQFNRWITKSVIGLIIIIALIFINLYNSYKQIPVVLVYGMAVYLFRKQSQKEIDKFSRAI